VVISFFVSNLFLLIFQCLSIFPLAPSSPPSDVKVIVVDSTSVEVTWEPPAEQSQNGILAGYKILLSEQTRHGQDLGQPMIVTVPANLRSYHIRNLNKWTHYRVGVLAFTKAGDGPISEAIVVQTDEDGR